MAEQVHWKQGLFLQPHHLQLMQRHLLEGIADLRAYTSPYPYGVVRWQLDEDAILKARVVRFRSLHVLMKSGREVRYSDQADASSNTELSALDIGPVFDGSSGSLSIFLAVPLWQGQRSNAYDPTMGDASRNDSLYVVRQTKILDENEANDPRNERTVDVRRINARLVINTSDLNGFEVIPLLKIRRGVQGELANKPIRDTNYIPPCMFVNSSVEIQSMVQSLSENLKASRHDLAQKLPKDGFNLAALREAQIGMLIKLQSLNRAAARLPSVLEVGTFPLFNLYLELCVILGDMVAVMPTKDDLFNAPRYQHENPYLAFSELCARIQSLISVVEKVTNVVNSIPFEDRLGKLVARISEEQLSRAQQFYLSVQTSADPTELVSVMQQGRAFKVKSLSRVMDALPGVALAYDVNPHASLNRQPGLVYFKVDMKGDEWARIAAEKDVAVKRPSLTWYPDAKYVLHMILAEKEQS